MNTELFLENTRIIICSSILALVLDSFIEWATHRFPMHHKMPGPLGKFLFHHHMTVHHALFSGEKYHHHGDEGRDTIAFPLWVGPLLIATAILPFWIVAQYTENFLPFWVSLFWAVLYYAVFEGIHQLMHMEDKPSVQWVRNSKIFLWLDTHHEIHHRMAGANFNLVLPLADWLTGTLVSFKKYCSIRKQAEKKSA